MKAATLLFFAIAIYLLGVIAQVLVAPIEALDPNAYTGAGDLTYSLVPLAQKVGAAVFLSLALIQLIDDTIGKRVARGADERRRRQAQQ